MSSGQRASNEGCDEAEPDGSHSKVPQVGRGGPETVAGPVTDVLNLLQVRPSSWLM